MDLQILIPLLVAVPFIIFPAVFIWYLNVGGLYAAAKERTGLRVFAPLGKVLRIGTLITVPVILYGLSIWYSLGHFGWVVALVVGLVMPIVLFVPLLVWASIASGLFIVARNAMRQRAVYSRRKATRLAEEPVIREVM